jgi:isochorismate synthase EntC
LPVPVVPDHQPAPQRQELCRRHAGAAADPRGSGLTVDAIAGTAPRAESTERDAELSKALLNSDKNLREHRCVVDAIVEALSDCCDDIAAPPRRR